MGGWLAVSTIFAANYQPWTPRFPQGILAADDSTMEDNSQALAVLLLLPLLWETNERPQSWPYARC